jgi:hypothetical protein
MRPGKPKSVTIPLPVNGDEWPASKAVYNFLALAGEQFCVAESALVEYLG